MVGSSGLARGIGPVALAVLVIYNLSVQLFDMPTPSRPWNFVLAIVLTLLVLAWIVSEGGARLRNRRNPPTG
jgi:hypothetical protein